MATGKQIKINNEKRLKRAKILITIAFTMFVVTFVIIFFSMISEIACRNQYFCGLQTFVFELFALIPVTISTILAIIGLIFLVKLHKQQIQIPKWGIVLAIISILQLLIFLLLNQFWALVL